MVFCNLHVHREKHFLVQENLWHNQSSVYELERIQVKSYTKEI